MAEENIINGTWNLEVLNKIMEEVRSQNKLSGEVTAKKLLILLMKQYLMNITFKTHKHRADLLISIVAAGIRTLNEETK